MKKRNKKILWIILIGFASFFLLLSILVNTHIIAFNNAVLTNRFPKEYVSLFKKNYGRKITIARAYAIPNRNDIADVFYEDKAFFEYSITIYKIDLSQKESLLKTIKYGQRKLNINSNKKYYNYIENFDVEYSADSTYPVSNINLTFDGDSVKTIIQNDSVFYCCLNLNSFSIAYNQNISPDLYVNTINSKFKGDLFEILLVKKNKSLYFLMMNNNMHKPYDNDLLYNMVNI